MCACVKRFKRIIPPQPPQHRPVFRSTQYCHPLVTTSLTHLSSFLPSSNSSLTDDWLGCLHVASFDTCVTPVSVATVCSQWRAAMGGICRSPSCFLFFFFFLPCYLPIIFGSSDFLHLLLHPLYHHLHHLMIYSTNVPRPDPQMLFLVARIWFFLLCLTQNITPNKTKHVTPPLYLWGFLSAFQMLFANDEMFWRNLWLWLWGKWSVCASAGESLTVTGTLMQEMHTNNVAFATWLSSESCQQLYPWKKIKCLKQQI